jgi:hypothetical protein
MGLIDFGALHAEESQPDSGFAEINHFDALTRSVLISNRQKLQDAFGDIRQGDNIFFMNFGRWSAHDLIMYALRYTGPSALHMTVWAISEKAARLLQSAIDSGAIQSIHCILDRRIEIRNARVIATVRNLCTRFAFVDCHAKLFVLKNDRWCLSILTTANLSNNLRIEAGHIYTDPAIGNMIIEMIDKVLTTEKPFEHGDE